MQHIRLFKKLIAALFLTMTGTYAIAQEAAPVQATASSSYNLLEILLMAMMIVLAFVIWWLSKMLLVLGRQLIEKNKIPKVLSVLWMLGLLFIAQSSSAQDTAQAASTATIANYGGISSTTFYMVVGVFITEVVIILFLVVLIKRLTTELLPQKAPAPAKANWLKIWWAKLDRKLTRAVPVEKEADVMLDHDYDGIRELDNALPPWWKYGFYITIGIAVVYLLNFEVFGYGKNPTEEYDAEMAKAKVQMEMYEATNKDKIDENNVPMADAAGLSKAKEIFSTKCFVCHGMQGEGSVGPNLTDDYWLHKGSLNDIYRSIKIGYPDKGMQSWANEFSPKEISSLASYVTTLHGTNPPNPKAPQGDLYVDSSASALPATDSLNTSTSDSTTITGKSNSKSKPAVTKTQ